MLSERLSKRIILFSGVLVALLAIGLTWDSSIRTFAQPSERPTIEQILPESSRLIDQRIRTLFPAHDATLLIALSGVWNLERLTSLESALMDVQSVRRVWSEALSFTDVLNDESRLLDKTALRKFFKPREDASLLLVFLESGSRDLSESRLLISNIERVIREHLEKGERFATAGTPQIRVGSWNAARRDLLWILPLILFFALGVPLLVFGSLYASLFPIAISMGTVVPFWIAYTYIHGPIDAFGLIMIPIIWSIATLDGLHLYHRVSLTDNPERVRRAIYAIFWPCFWTTLTTAGGFLVLALPESSPLIRRFALWCSVSSVFAWMLTLGLGHLILSRGSLSSGRAFQTEAMCKSLIQGAQGRSRLVISAWVVLILVASVGIPRVRTDDRFPHIFESSTSEAKDLRWLSDLTSTNLSPIEILLEPKEDFGEESPKKMILSSLSVARYLESLPETRLVLPWSFVEGESIQKWGVLSPSHQSANLDFREVFESQDIRGWFLVNEGVARLTWYTSSISLSRKEEILDWLRHFDETNLSHHELRFGGSGALYFKAEKGGRDAALVGGGFAALLLVLALGFAFNSVRVWIVALIGNLIPLIFVFGLMGWMDIPWSLALVPLPAMVMCLSVDDTIHLLWACRRNEPFEKNRAGPPLLATSAILVLCIGTLSFSSLQGNAELGLLLPFGLVVAFLADMTLVPALLMIAPRRSAR